jgi:Asp-tRNA(Asn)/Glu-tRNA(Gln) amidotransferase A subunit family amidase
VLGDEFPHFTVLGGIILGYLPPLLLSLLSRLLKAIPFTHRIGILLEHTFAHSYPSVSKVWQMNSEIKTYQNDFLENMKLSKLDFILCPTMALPAINHQQSVNLLPVVMYTSIFNILQFPVGHVPITRVQADECYYSEKGNGDLMSQLANEQMKDSQGLPVGISVIGLPYDDESVLNLMSVLEKKFPFVPSI